MVPLKDMVCIEEVGCREVSMRFPTQEFTAHPLQLFSMNGFPPHSGNRGNNPAVFPDFPVILFTLPLGSRSVVIFLPWYV